MASDPCGMQSLEAFHLSHLSHLDLPLILQRLERPRNHPQRGRKVSRVGNSSRITFLHQASPVCQEPQALVRVLRPVHPGLATMSRRLRELLPTLAIIRVNANQLRIRSHISRHVMTLHYQHPLEEMMQQAHCGIRNPQATLQRRLVGHIGPILSECLHNMPIMVAKQPLSTAALAVLPVSGTLRLIGHGKRSRTT